LLKLSGLPEAQKQDPKASAASSIDLSILLTKPRKHVHAHRAKASSDNQDPKPSKGKAEAAPVLAPLQSPQGVQTPTVSRVETSVQKDWDCNSYLESAFAKKH
jgi:hypothetical protein